MERIDHRVKEESKQLCYVPFLVMYPTFVMYSTFVMYPTFVTVGGLKIDQNRFTKMCV